MPIAKTVRLNTGADMPVVGLGTWQSPPGHVEKAVEAALRIGYRHIDTAYEYENETEVGIGIKASGVPREEIFVTTKLPNTHHRKVKDALDASLQKLDTGYLDLWLMHWPAPMLADYEGPDKGYTWQQAWEGMVQVFRENPEKVRAIGVSNFSVPFLRNLLALETGVIPAVNQIELHPYCQKAQQEIVDECLKHHIVLTAYSPLGSGYADLLKEPLIEEIAKKYSATPANVLISLHANKAHHTVIPKSVDPSRIEANFKLTELSEDEIKQLESLGDKLERPYRTCMPGWTGYGSLGFSDCADQIAWE